MDKTKKYYEQKRGHINARLPFEMFEEFDAKAQGLGYSRSEIMRALVIAFLRGAIVIPHRDDVPEIPVQSGEENEL